MTLTATAHLRSRSVLAALQYQEPSAQKPYIGFGYSGAAHDVGVAYTSRRIPIHDAWHEAHALSLDVQGFALVKHVSAVRDYGDDAEIERVGRAEAADIVWRATGAEEVLVFDHTVRRRAPDAARQPSTRVHNDYTETSGPQRVRDLTGERAEALLRKRFAYVNVWRPIRHPAADSPLALCDARSAAPADFVATDIIYPDRRGEIYGLTYSPAHRWSYFPNMGLDQALLIKCYDSRRDVARFTPHVAFEDPNTPADAPPRESVEYRAIAFFA
jgi:hypothetical protein